MGRDRSILLEKNFNRRTVLKERVIKEKVIGMKNIITNKATDGILPSNLNFSKNVVFPPIENACCTKKNYCKSSHKKKSCPCTNFTIRQKDVGTSGIIINKPGYYKFCSDITFNPTEERTIAIIISASNVILDLKKYSLIQGNVVPNVYGIAVARDVKYVSITGIENIATIRNFTLASGRVFGRTQYISINNIISKQDIPVQLTNDQIPVNCADILNLSLNLGFAIGEGDTFGVHMQGTNKLNLVEQLSINNVTCDGSTIGCHIIFTFGFEILNSVFTKNTYYGLLHGTGWVVPGDGPLGLEFPVGGNGVITDCRFEGNHGLNADLANPGDEYVFDFVSGIANYDVSNVKIDRCLVDDNSNDGYIIAADHDAARNIKWTNSIVTGTRSIFEPADGLHFSGSIPLTVGDCTGAGYPLVQDFNITVANCTSTDGRSEESRAVGFLMAYVQGAHISNCNASGMSGGISSAGFNVVGGLPGGRTSAITLVNNTAERNGATGGGRSAGFLIEEVSDNIVLKDNIANNNGTGPDLVSGAGFLIRLGPTDNDPASFIKNMDLDNCTAKGNGNGSELSGGFVIYNATTEQITTIENIAIEKSVSKFNNGYGILIDGNIVGSSVNETEIYQNTLGGLVIRNNSNDVFTSRNVASLNNANNYTGIAPVNIVTGTVNALPPNPGFLNVSIN